MSQHEFLQSRISRENQDRWALRSQQRSAAARAAGKLEGEVAAIEVPGRKDCILTARSAPGLNFGAAATVAVEALH